MTNSFADSVVSGMLSWLKGFASWVLRLFDLAGSGGVSPLEWLSDNWLPLLIVLLIVGVAVDWIVWLIRWRPYWVWFHKKRVVVDDENFFDEKKHARKGSRVLSMFVVDEREAEQQPKPARKPSTIVKRDDAPERRDQLEKTRIKARPVRSARRAPRRAANKRPLEAHAVTHDIFDDDLFKIKPARSASRRVREDEVFNVANLPGKKKRPVIKREETADDELFRAN